MWSVLKKMPDGTVDMSTLNLKYNLTNLKKNNLHWNILKFLWKILACVIHLN